ncbi:MAG: hypothetical protein KGH54_00990 [Candidatus Micrarchaeota archaeon]|nr:hypothetical protein [Candidatus Micrarchaeota archaeon]
MNNQTSQEFKTRLKSFGSAVNPINDFKVIFSEQKKCRRLEAEAKATGLKYSEKDTNKLIADLGKLDKDEMRYVEEIVRIFGEGKLHNLPSEVFDRRDGALNELAEDHENYFKGKKTDMTLRIDKCLRSIALEQERLQAKITISRRVLKLVSPIAFLPMLTTAVGEAFGSMNLSKELLPLEYAGIASVPIVAFILISYGVGKGIEKFKTRKEKEESKTAEQL